MPTKNQLKRFAPAAFRNLGLEVVAVQDSETKVVAEAPVAAPEAPVQTDQPVATAPVEQPVTESQPEPTTEATTEEQPQAPEMPAYADMTVKQLKELFDAAELDALPDLRKDTLVAAAENKWMAGNA